MLKTNHALYIHWPFCKSKCPYCDFNSHVFRGTEEDAWRSAYRQELEYYKNHYPIGSISSIFFGGGTPSLMSPELVGNVLNDAEKILGFVPNIEITLEANPTSVEAEKFKAYAAAGVNRLSMGIQALNDKDLQKLGRTHSALEAMKAFEVAKNNFNSVSFDLIYARENQTMAAWKEELKQAASLAVDHISLYQLTIEEGTRFADWYKRGKITVPNDELCEEMYFHTSDFLRGNGYDHYEISNFAKTGKQCQHNLAYWRYQPYIGIGPGAHGRICGHDGLYLATETAKMPNDYLEKIIAVPEPPFANTEKIESNDMVLEFLLMGLRLEEGINLERFDNIALDMNKISRFMEEGYLEHKPDHLRLTLKGRPIMNYILSEILL